MAKQQSSQKQPTVTQTAIAAPMPFLQPRAFAEPNTAITENALQQPDLQAQIDQASTFGHSLGRINPCPLSTLPIQPKLTIGKVGDPYEQEADRVAAQVVQQINQPVAATPGKASVQRQAIGEEDELQMKPDIQQRSDVGGMAASSNLESSINQARGSGQGLSDSIRQPMEQAFGADFSSVRVHTDSQSDQLSRSINAQAFTTKNDIFFSKGAYSPGDRGGQELLAHELTHVVQQGGASVQRKLARSPQNSIPNLPIQTTQPTSDPGTVQRFNNIGSLDKNTSSTAADSMLQDDKDDKRSATTEATSAFTIGNTADALGSREDLLGIKKDEQLEGEAGTGIGFGMANSLLSIGFAIKQFGGAKSLGPKAEAIFSGAGGLIGTGEMIAKAVKLGTGADDKSSSAAAAGIMGAVGAGCSVLVNIVKSISKIKDVFKEDDLKNETAFEKKMNAGASVFQTIQSGVTLAQKVMAIYETSGANEMLQYALPGIGLIVSACELIMRSYGIYKASESYRAMAVEKKAAKQNLSQNKDAKQFFGKTFWGNTSTNLDQLDLVVANPALFQSVPDAIKGELKHYHLVHEMKYINQKRIVRESILVGTELVKVGGEIAIMTGAGAGVGVGMKGGAAGVKAGMVVVRGVKQAYRDNYDTDSRKSSSAKQSRRIKHAQMIFDMIEQASLNQPKDQAKVEAYLTAEKQKIDKYLLASGVYNLEQWYRSAGRSPDNAFVALCAAMQKRQFG